MPLWGGGSDGMMDITFTSPPYNAGHMDINNPDGSIQEGTTKKYLGYEDDMDEGEYSEFITKNLGLMLNVSREVFYNMGMVAGNKRAIIDLLSTYADNFKDLIYWKKSTVAPHIQKGTMSSVIELIMAFGSDNNTRNFAIGDVHYFNGVIEGGNASGNEYADIHKATFPVYLPSEIIGRFTKPGDMVMDCFGGTGTTLMACEQLGRKCRMMELDPHYCDVIIKRWEDFTGRKAERVVS